MVVSPVAGEASFPKEKWWFILLNKHGQGFCKIGNIKHGNNIIHGKIVWKNF